MSTRLIQLHDQNAVLVLLAHSIQKHLEAIAIEVRELIEERLTGGWFHDAVQVGGLKLPLHFAFRLDAFGCDLAPTDGFESDPRFILTEEAHLPTQSHDRHGIPSQQRQILSEFFYMPLPVHQRSLHSRDEPLWARL